MVAILGDVTAAELEIESQSAPSSCVDLYKSVVTEVQIDKLSPRQSQHFSTRPRFGVDTRDLGLPDFTGIT